MAVGTITKPKIAGFIDPDHINANKKRIEKEEAELEELIKKASGEEEEEEPKAEEAPKKAPKKEEASDTEDKEPLTAEERTYKKRYDDLRTHMNALNAKIKTLEEKQQPSLTPPKTDEDVAAWMRKYPDVAAIVEAIAEKKATERFSEAEGRLRMIDEMTAEASRVKYEAEIRSIHPDFDTLRDSEAFHTWAEEQPKWVQNVLYEDPDDPKGVIKAISLYKYENGLDTKGKQESAKKAASAVMTKRTKPDVDVDGSGKRFSESQVNKMSIKEYEAKQEEIAEAIRSGNFVYDLSGGAR